MRQSGVSALTPVDKPAVAVWWIKRDMRLADNAALTTAIATELPVLPLYVVETELLMAADASRLHWLAQRDALHELQENLAARGCELLFGQGSVTGVLDALNELVCPRLLVSHQETGTVQTFERDKQVARWTHKHRIRWLELPQNGVIRGAHERQDRPRILADRLHHTTPLPAPSRIHSLPLEGFLRDKPAVTEAARPRDAIDGLLSVSIPAESTLSFTPAPLGAKLDVDQASYNASATLNATGHRGDHALQQVSETAAAQVLSSFLESRSEGYRSGISSPNRALHTGSRLSAQLAWGTVSLRQVFQLSQQRLQQLSNAARPGDASVARWKKDLQAFQSRLFWHDHFVQRLEAFPSMEAAAINPAYEAMKYPGSSETLHAWVHGQTGLPLVDACMRCLHHTGFINFRMRAMLVSIGCYSLGLSWRQIQYPLAQVFLDYEPGIHFSQVQMQAGIVGINTIRVYNAHKQLLEQDPECVFVKRWVPELREFEAVDIANYQHRQLGDYPAPVADTEAVSQHMKAQIFAIRRSEAGKQASEQVLAAHGSQRPRHGTRTGKRKSAPPDSRQLSLDL